MPYQMECIEPAPLDPAAEQVMVPMRDRVRLATDVYLPRRPGRQPAVLVRLPYDKCGRYTFMPRLAPCFTDRGYAFVVQDVRGKFRSEGETMPFVHEVEDGYDTLEWIVAQPWSNGAVGMWGDSYFGYTQWAVVASGHSALKAIVPRVTTIDLMDLDERWADSVVQLYGADYLAHFWTDKFIYDFEPDWSRRPLAEAFDHGFARIGKRCQGFDRLMLRRGAGDFSMYPRGRHPVECQRIPALHSVGWFDNIAPGSMRDYTELCAHPQRASLQYLIADAVDHENYRLHDFPIRPADDHEIEDAALSRLLPTLTGPGLDFFDVFVKGEGDATSVPRVRWCLGNDGWRESAEWPPRGARELRFYLGGAGTAGADGHLARSVVGPTALVHWVHDPDHLVPSALVDPFSLIKHWPDEREIEARDDVLTFTCDPVKQPLDLAGPVRATLRVGSSAASMHVHAKLLDVFPDGSARMLVRGQARVDGPDVDRAVTVDLGHTGYRVLPGHRLRLHLACSDFPLYLWHPGTTEDPWLATRGVVNKQTLKTGGDTGSSVSLSVLEPNGGGDHDGAR
jgi:hypothetical protein